MSFQELIKEYRKNKNMTQEELAKKLNVSSRAVSNYEIGIRTPDIYMWKRISEVLEIPSEEILGDESMLSQKEKSFFTKEDFERFVQTWEYQTAGCDIDKNLLKKTRTGFEYHIYETENKLILHNGQILWENPAWDSDFVEEFEDIVEQLIDKKLYEKPVTFIVNYKNFDLHQETIEVQGYEEDTEEEVFLLAALEAAMNEKESLTGGTCYDLEYKQKDKKTA